MKTIVNKTPRPIKIRLPRGKVLHLGPTKTGQISDDALERDAVQALLKAGDIEVVGEGQAQGGAGPQPLQQATHGHQPATKVHPKGDR
jgi:hypothetical protein